MVMKVSTSMFFDKASKQLGSIQGSLAKTQEQLSTGKQINKPSDEPDKASLITRLDSELARQKSYQRQFESGEYPFTSRRNRTEKHQQRHVPFQRVGGASWQRHLEHQLTDAPFLWR